MIDPATVALCVGHSRRLPAGHPEGGAWTHDGKFSEWKWNQFIGRMAAAALHERHGIACFLVDDYGARSYGAAMAWLARELRGLGNIRLAVELHFNSASATANGHEWLHWPGSPQGRLLATELHLAMIRKFPGIRARGVKTPVDGRGDAFLKLTHCPAVIAEPFFGSNPHDWATVSARADSLVNALADGIAAYHKRIFPSPTA
jgi:N-acetylmuramoyl-L-alanine amidase